jgi:transcriptional regulator with XRE-family HTH domain
MLAPDLVHAAMKRHEISMRKLADELGVSHTIVSRWASGERTPDFEHAAALAELAGLPAIRTAAEIRSHVPATRRVHALLRKIATAAVIFITVTYVTKATITTGPTFLHKENILDITHS